MSEKLDAISFQCSVDIEAAEASASAGSKPGMAKFSMLAYGGGAMKCAGWRYPVVVDLAGLKQAAPSIPIRLQHDAAQGVGHSTEVNNNGSNLRAKGIISRSTPAAQEVAASGKQGFPWQASVGLSVEESQFVGENETAQVNNRKHSGPLTIARKSTLNEISFVDLGADTQTSAVVTGAAMTAQNGGSLMLEEIVTERKRVKEIRAACAGIKGVESLQLQAEDEGWSVEQTKAQLFEHVKASKEAMGAAPRHTLVTNPPPNIHIKASEFDGDVSEYIQAGAMVMRSHDELAVKHFGEQRTEFIRAHRPGSLKELLMNACQMKGIYPRNTNELMAAFSSISAPTALGSSMEKFLISAYEATEDTATKIAKPVDLNSFRPGAVLRLNNEKATLDELGPHSEMKHAFVGELAYQVQNSSFGKTIILSRQDIINDNSNMLDETPFSMGQAAKQKLGSKFWSYVLSNPSSYFSSGNKNLATGGGSALSFSSLTTAIAALLNRTNADGEPISMKPATLVVGPSLLQTARGLLHSAELIQYVSSSIPTLPRGNSMVGLVPNLEVESRLELDNYGNSLTNWFLFSSPSNAPFLISYLNGARFPILQALPQSAEMQIGTISWQLIFDFGIGSGDPKASYWSKGA